MTVAGEDLYHVDEELSPVAEEGAEEEWDDERDESDLEEVNGPECLWRDGEHEPEGDPEEWFDRVADAVEEKRLQKVHLLEKPEGSAKGISYLTTSNVYDWRIPTWRWNINQKVEEKTKTSCKRICFR